MVVGSGGGGLVVTGTVEGDTVDGNAVGAGVVATMDKDVVDMSEDVAGAVGKAASTCVLSSEPLHAAAPIPTAMSHTAATRLEFVHRACLDAR